MVTGTSSSSLVKRILDSFATMPQRRVGFGLMELTSENPRRDGCGRTSLFSIPLCIRSKKFRWQAHPPQSKSLFQVRTTPTTITLLMQLLRSFQNPSCVFLFKDDDVWCIPASLAACVGHGCTCIKMGFLCGLHCTPNYAETLGCEQHPQDFLSYNAVPWTWCSRTHE